MTADQAEVLPRWGMPDAAFCFVAGFVTANIGIAVASAAGASVDSLVATSAGLIGLWVGLVGSMLAVSRAKGAAGMARDFGLRFERFRDLIGIPMGAGFQLIVVPVIYVPLSRIITDLDNQLEAPARELTDTAGRGAGLLVLGVLVVVGAPIVEELFYRGMLLRSVQRRFGDKVAIGASAATFAIAHFEPLLFPALLALGVLLGVLAVRSGRLGPAIFAHAGFNAVTMAILASRA